MTSMLVVALMVGALDPVLRPVAEIPARMICTVAKIEQPMDSHETYVVSSTQIREAPRPQLGVFAGIDWAADANEVLVSACATEPTPACHVERLTLDGILQQTYPSWPIQPFAEEDGRLTPGGARGPVRISSDGRFLALAANRRALAVLESSTGDWVLGVTQETNGFDWSPSGHVLAYTRPEEEKDLAAAGAQLFLFDIATRQERQLTFLPPKEYRSWWRFWAAPFVRKAHVTGISWAKRSNLILFYNAPDRGIYVWTPEGKQMAFLQSLQGDCWRHTQLSGDGQRILYLSSSRSALCTLNGGNEVRMVNVDGSDDHVVLRAEPGYVIMDVDWRTE